MYWACVSLGLAESVSVVQKRKKVSERGDCVATLDTHQRSFAEYPHSRVYTSVSAHPMRLRRCPEYSGSMYAASLLLLESGRPSLRDR